MEKAKIEIKKTKKNKVFGELIFENNNKMSIPKRFQINPEMDGKDCFVKRSNGQIVKITIDNMEIKIMNNNPPKKDNKKHTSSKNKNNNYPTIENAIAPYNFVPLNKEVVTQKKPDDFDKYSNNTGYIELDIETKTPIFIKGEGSDFYKQAGKYRIPGSSMRGMIRTLVEIASWSMFGFLNDSYLYYRSFTDKAHRFRDEYKKNMISENQNEESIYNMESGLLYKDGLEYRIIPENKKFEKIKKPNSKVIISNLRNTYQEESFYIINENEYIVVPGKKFKESWENRNDWKIFCDKNKENSLTIPSKDIYSYINDKNRKSKNLIKRLKNVKYIPIFYVRWVDLEKNERISFGHTPLFRLSYKKSIKEHIIQEDLSEKKFDIASNIFGREDDFSTRVFFNDFILEDHSEDKIFSCKIIPKTLSSPNPTSFQLYLDQTDANNNINKLNHYNDNVCLRGNKLYWHKSGDCWEEEIITVDKRKFEYYLETKNQQFSDFNVYTQNQRGNKIDIKIKELNPEKYKFIVDMIKEEMKKETRHIETQHSVIKPISSGANFKGRIRFENLTDIELGALLFVLKLPKNCCHKIGMGKPIGLGSIKITPRLYFSDRTERYKKLFYEWNGLNEKSEDINNKVNEFEKFILKEINQKDKKSLWENDRMKELKKMLDFENKPADSKTDYMKFNGRHNGFSERLILPKANNVK